MPPLAVGTAGCVVERRESGGPLQSGCISALLGAAQGV